jgi:hypothetical protein
MSSAQGFSLAIVASNEDAVLLLKPYCVTCATIKLDVIRFCSISTEDAKDLVKTCGVRCVRVKCDPSLHKT